jgi:phosphopantetheinyl transferase
MRCGSRFIPKGSSLVACLTTTTNLAVEIEKSKPKTTLLSEYAAFSSVFSEEASSCLPPSYPYDHAINLDETFVSKIGKVYSLSPDEQKATEAFLEENLHSRKIRPSKSPQASSFFFVKKKDGKFCPCQDY